LIELGDDDDDDDDATGLEDPDEEGLHSSTGPADLS